MSNNRGILLVNKPKGKTSFSLISVLRRHSGIQKIGHAGTLDPLASGVMILLIGKEYTRLSDSFLGMDKEYLATIHLGISTDTYDSEGAILSSSSITPSLEQIETSLLSFQGEILQIPPMYSAKKIQGKKLYDLARNGIEVPREPVKLTVQTKLLDYAYPHLTLLISCSKGTYIRSIAHDLGALLGCGGHLSALVRTRCGPFHLEQCLDGSLLYDVPSFPYRHSLIHDLSAYASLSS